VWVAVPLALLLIFFAADSRRLYFEHYLSLCPFCDATTQARYAQALGKDYKAYQLGVGSYDVFFSYGSTRFVARGVEGVDLTVPADFLPVTDEGRGAAFLVMLNNLDYLSILRTYYPMGLEESVRSPDGIERFKSFKVTEEQLASTRTVQGIFTLPDGTLLMRKLPAFGVVDEASARWASARGVGFPSQVTWQAGLVAPSYGVYAFELKGGTSPRLEIDGRPVVEGGGGVATVVLARGMHDVRLTDTVGGAGKLDLLWAGAGGPTTPIAPGYIYNGTTGGLSGEFAPMSTLDDLKAPDPLGRTARFLRRSDGFFGYKEATNSVGQAAFIARWQGWINVPADGMYGFSTHSNGPSMLLIDGKPVVENMANGSIAMSNGQLELTRGRHQIDLRYVWYSGRATLELYWSRPDGERELIPPDVLEPLARSWSPDEVQDAPVAQLPQNSATREAERREPVQVMGGLSNPRGIAVDAQGNVFVGDRGNGRVVMFGPDGKEVRSWGKAAPADKQDNPAPGEFADISDIAVGADNTVFVMDYRANRLHLYTREGELKLTLGGDILGTSSGNGIALSRNGDLFIATTAQSRIAHFTNPAALTEETKATAGGTVRSITGGEGLNKIEQPLDVVVDPADPSRVYVADLRDRIALIEGGNTIAREWLLPTGREDGGGRLAASPDGGTLYLSDPDRNRVAVLNTADGALSFFGGAGGDPGQFLSPGGVAVGIDGRIYVLDRGNGRVQVFEP
jgi:DNA-binding beta-propeller fold protein YncE